MNFLFLLCVLCFIRQNFSLCPADCNRYSPDGCNECFCDNYDLEHDCTSNRECLVPHAPYCTQCSDPNMKWNECGSACPTTCDNVDQGPIICTMQCVAQCQCPSDKVYHEGACITKEECPQYNNTTNDKCFYNYQVCQNNEDCKNVKSSKVGISFECVKDNGCTSSACSLNSKCEKLICTKDCRSNSGWCKPI